MHPTPEPSPIGPSSQVFPAVLLILVASLGVSACMSSATPKASAEPAFRFSGREPLGDLCVKLGQMVHKGFVLGVPSLHDLPISLYIPPEASPAQAIETFRAALKAHSLVLTEHTDYWIISPPPPQPAPPPAPEDAPFQQTKAGLLIDLDQVRLVEVTRTLSQLSGLRFAISPELTEHRITIQALKPVSPAEALDLLIATLTIEGVFVYRKGDLISISPSPVSALATPYIDDGPVIPPRTAQSSKSTEPKPPRPLPDTIP